MVDDIPKPDITPPPPLGDYNPPRIPPIGPKSPIARAFQLKNDRVMLLCEDGNRIWFTPGRDDGNPELQADYQEFLKTHRLEGV
jgi:hypothetical protein